VIFVFTGLGNLSLAAMRYRAGDRSFLSGLFEKSEMDLFAPYLPQRNQHSVNGLSFRTLYQQTDPFPSYSKSVVFSISESRFGILK
jgi:hypothetical protein